MAPRGGGREGVAAEAVGGTSSFFLACSVLPLWMFYVVGGVSLFCLSLFVLAARLTFGVYCTLYITVPRVRFSEALKRVSEGSDFSW